LAVRGGGDAEGEIEVVVEAECVVVEGGPVS
jgi:hypothetical protein